MNIIECDQGSSDWLEIRRGKVTASNIGKVMDFLKKGGETQKRADYKAVLIAEILSGRTSENFVSDDMAWGTLKEPEARRAYALANGVYVDQVGFVIHPTIERAGASPDGLIDPEGALEIKCPRTSTHIRWILDGVVPPEHEPQLAWVMACTGAQWCDFVSFDNRLPKRFEMFWKRLYRDERRIAELEAGASAFLGEVDDLIECLNGLYPPEPETARKAPKSQLDGQLEASLSAEDIAWASAGFPERRSA